MPKNLNQRLRHIDRRSASVDRRLGFLSMRLYFQPLDGARVEVSIFAAADLGTTAKNQKTGEEVTAHRYRFSVDRDWLDQYAGVIGVWSIAPEGEPPLESTLEDQTIADEGTDGVLVFRIDLQSSFILPEIPPL